MTPGWTPTAIAATGGTTGSLEFEVASADRNDRMLMLSMMGVVVMTVAAIGYAFITRPKDAAPAPVPTVVEQPVVRSTPPPQLIPERNYYVPAPQGAAPVQQQTYQPAPTYIPPPQERPVQAVARGSRVPKSQAILGIVKDE